MTIPKTIRAGAEKLIERLQSHGTLAAPKALEELNTPDGVHLPQWLIELLSELPLAGIQIGVTVTDKLGGLHNEPVMFELGDAALITEINTTSYPGMYLFPRGYVAIGCGIEWAGDVLVLATNAEDPPAYQVWHDVSHDPEELECAVLNGERGTRLISQQFSDLLHNGLAEPPVTV